MTSEMGYGRLHTTVNPRVKWVMVEDALFSLHPAITVLPLLPHGPRLPFSAAASALPYGAAWTTGQKTQWTTRTITKFTMQSDGSVAPRIP